MSQHKKRRERRYQAAAALVGDGDGDALPGRAGEQKDARSEEALLREFANSMDSSQPAGAAGRSQPPSDEISSHMFQPRWHRLVQAVGEIISRRLDDSCSTEVPCEAARRLVMLTNKTDGVGGGTVEDVSRFLEGLLVKSQLNDSDAGFVLLHTCHHIQCGDLIWSVATWRSLLLLASLVAVREVCASAEEPVREKMLAYVKHWWPEGEINLAQEAFVERSNYKRRPPTRSALAKLYFELRDQGLRLSADASSNASAVFLSDAFDSRREAPSGEFARHGGDQFGEDSGALSLSSLRISESSSSFSSSALHEEIFPKKRERQKKSIVSL